MIALLLWPVWIVGIFAVGMLVDFDESSESHWVGGALLSVGMVMLGLKLFGLSDISWRTIDYLLALKCFLIYVGIGLLWSFIRFYRLSKKVKITGGGMDTVKRQFPRLFDRVPVWIAFWPPSMLWSSLSDLVAPFFEWVADMFKMVYVRLFEMATGGKVND